MCPWICFFYINNHCLVCQTLVHIPLLFKINILVKCLKNRVCAFDTDLNALQQFILRVPAVYSKEFYLECDWSCLCECVRLCFHTCICAHMCTFEWFVHAFACASKGAYACVLMCMSVPVCDCIMYVSVFMDACADMSVCL